VATALLGVLTGQWAAPAADDGCDRRSPRARRSALRRGGQIWGAWFPVNKSLWTSSYVMLMGGLALITLAACYWLIEVRGHRRWAVPFVVFGVNALALYFLSTAVARVLVLIHVGPENATFSPCCSTACSPRGPRSSTLRSPTRACYVLVWLGLMWPLYQRRIVLRV